MTDDQTKEWRDFANKVAAKKNINRKRKSTGEEKKPYAMSNNAIKVQRLTSSVSGKAQKFHRIGTCEFVPYEKANLTINGIREACENISR